MQKRKSLKQRYTNANDVSSPKIGQIINESQDNPEYENLEKPKEIKMLNESNAHEEKIENKRLILKYLDSLNEESKITCNKCNKNYANKISFNNHKASAHNKIKYSCDQCEYRASV